MRYTKTFIPTVKEVPADAEIISHQLMIRAGLMRKLASGTYTYLPAGWRILLKIIDIVRDEMNKSGAQEILMPAVQPIDLWQKTGRDVDYGETLGTFRDRHGRINVLAPTAEEVVTSLAAGEISSYKQLPMNIYQISFKFRDEFRPRFGVLRSREFIMKDSYSFHADPESLDETYKVMYETYCKIFRRCGLEYVIVEAESGEMGGTGSHQFTVPCESGEDIIVFTQDGSYAANIEKASVDPLPKQNPLSNPPAMQEVHTPDVGSIEAVCEFLKCRPQEMIKTLIYSADTETIVAVVRGDHDINPEKLAASVGGRHIELADEDTIEKITAAAVGFAGPMGLAQKVNLVLIDPAVAAMAVGITGANKTDYHIKNVVPGRDFALEGENTKVVDIRNAVQGDTFNSKPLLFRRGIEVGQVFKLGKKYSAKLDAKFLDAEGKEKPCLMGCYGIGINRILASAIEISHDDKGPILPITIAPWEVIITPAGAGEEITGAAENIHAELAEKGIEVLLDDRPDIRAGVKFNDADLLGIPVRVTVGQKSLAAGNVEIKLRNESESKKVPLTQAADEIIATVNSLKAKLNVGNPRA
ncbi:MAG TPA: proline--tRNA ligase [Planctomycetes bacterium]|nr:proline--tRNA ligase [Planctomycetota bacterium]